MLSVSPFQKAGELLDEPIIELPVYVLESCAMQSGLMRKSSKINNVKIVS